MTVHFGSKDHPLSLWTVHFGSNDRPRSPFWARLTLLYGVSHITFDYELIKGGDTFQLQ